MIFDVLGKGILHLYQLVGMRSKECFDDEHTDGIPLLRLLPQAMVADISESDAKKTGENREGMFYAARTFAFKLGQSVSMLLFTALATIGTNGMGYRIVAAASSALALIGGCILIFYNEKKIDQVIAETE